MSFEVQQAIIDVLLKKTLKAMKDYSAKSLILGGGVSANQALRDAFKKALENSDMKFFVPAPHLSTDNALMPFVLFITKKNQNLGKKLKLTVIYAWVNKKASWKNLEANANLRVDNLVVAVGMLLGRAGGKFGPGRLCC